MARLCEALLGVGGCAGLRKAGLQGARCAGLVCEGRGRGGAGGDCP